MQETIFWFDAVLKRLCTNSINKWNMNDLSENQNQKKCWTFINANLKIS